MSAELIQELEGKIFKTNNCDLDKIINTKMQIYNANEEELNKSNTRNYFKTYFSYLKKTYKSCKNSKIA